MTVVCVLVLPKPKPRQRQRQRKCCRLKTSEGPTVPCMASSQICICPALTYATSCNVLARDVVPTCTPHGLCKWASNFQHRSHGVYTRCREEHADSICAISSSVMLTCQGSSNLHFSIRFPRSKGSWRWRNLLNRRRNRCLFAA